LQKMEGGGKRKEVHQALENDLSQILTKEQFEKFKTIEAQHREQVKNRKDQKTQSPPAEQRTNQDSSQPGEQK